MLKRLLYRASQSKVKRADDKEDVMKKRINTFNKSIPIFARYKKAGQVRRIDANSTIEEIFLDLETTFSKAGLIRKCPIKPKVIFVMGGPGAGKGT
jgi:adenylate kinase family enzyme